MGAAGGEPERAKQSKRIPVDAAMKLFFFLSLNWRLEGEWLNILV